MNITGTFSWQWTLKFIVIQYKKQIKKKFSDKNMFNLMAIEGPFITVQCSSRSIN